MPETTHHIATPKNIWRGREDEPPDQKLFHRVHISDDSLLSQESLVHFFGFSSDEGVRRNQGRIGAALGPNHIRQALANISLHDCSFKMILDHGTIACPLHGDLDTAQVSLGKMIAKVTQQKPAPIVVLGGGHETAWATYQGLREQYGDDLSIVNFDAHFDLRNHTSANGATSGTPFNQIAENCLAERRSFLYDVIGIQKTANTAELFARADSLGVRYLLAEHIKTISDPTFMENLLSRGKNVYLSICLDVFSAAYAPGVSAINPLGIDPKSILDPIKKIAKSGKLVALEVVELSPPLDLHEQTAKLAAQLIALALENWKAN